MTEFGKTPYLTVDEFSDMGYSCVIYPVSTFRIANQAINNFLADLKAKGSQKDMVPQMQTRKELYGTIKYTPGQEWYYPNSTNKQ
jgi:methylisocitrate lyase